jgi:hypothetical protein
MFLSLNQYLGDYLNCPAAGVDAFDNEILYRNKLLASPRLPNEHSASSSAVVLDWNVGEQT